MNIVLKRLALAVAALAVFVPTSAQGATTPAGVIYAGEHTGRTYVVIEVNPRRTQVRKLTFNWEASCEMGPAATPQTERDTGWSEYRGPFAIRSGKWSRTLSLGPFRDGDILQRFELRMSGGLVGGWMRGSLRGKLIETNLAGDVIRTCDSGPLSYKVKDRSVFGGITTQRKNLVFVNLDATRQRVTKVAWDWHGVCELGPAARPDTLTSVFYHDRLFNFRFNSAGKVRWSGVDTTEIIESENLARTYSYSVSLKRTSTAVAGSIVSSFVDVDRTPGAATYNQVVRTCRSVAPANFTARD